MLAARRARVVPSPLRERARTILPRNGLGEGSLRQDAFSRSKPLTHSSSRDNTEPAASPARRRGAAEVTAVRHDRSRRAIGTVAARGRRALAFQFPVGPDRRSRCACHLACDRSAHLPGLAELPDAAHRGAAGRVHARQFPHRLFRRRDLRPVRQFGDLRDRHRGVRAAGRHCARLDERAHQHAVQEAVLRALDHPAGDPRHPVHGGVDAAREPEDRAS